MGQHASVSDWVSVSPVGIGVSVGNGVTVGVSVGGGIGVSVGSGVIVGVLAMILIGGGATKPMVGVACAQQ